ncbi:MAG: hypothetical protein COA79_01125 [Planctomycetota bacterium]|nr:MAG: hypothetical protein COA79_01125 [Planctomycetota bacterium]
MKNLIYTTIFILIFVILSSCSSKKKSTKIEVTNESQSEKIIVKKEYILPYLIELDEQKSQLMSKFKYWSARMLTTDPDEIILDLDHSSDGKKLLMTTSSKKFHYIYLLDLKRASMPRLIYKDTRKVLWSRFFNADKNVLFSINIENENAYLSSLDLNNPINQIPKRLTQKPESFLGISSINSEKAYAISRTIQGNNSIELMKDNLIYKKFTKALEPSWSSSGTSLVFLSDIFGKREIVKYDSFQNGLQRVTISQGKVHSPRFSPDQNWVIYSSTKSGKSNIYAIHIATSTIKRISHLKDMEFTKPIWCPTGSIFAIGSKNGKSYLFQFNHLARSFHLQINGNPGPTLNSPAQEVQRKILLEN